MMRRLILAAAAIMMLVLGTSCAKAPVKPGKWTAETSSWSATVVSVDPVDRYMTLKGPNGIVFDFKVRPEVENFDKVKAGDIVDVDVIESYAMYVRKAEDFPYVQQNSVEDFGTEGGLPSKTVVDTLEATARVKAVDYDKRTLTLVDSTGKTFVIHVPNSVKKFENIKKGDEVVTRYTQNTVYSVRKP